jgi:hypothetical protein
MNQPMPTPDVMFSWIADGSYRVTESSAGIEVFPYLFQHHFTHEAGERYLLRWTSANTEAKIRQMRRDFIIFLRDEYGLANCDPDLYQNEPLANQIDLGRGNTIAPYVVNHMTNQRLIAKKRKGEMVQFPELDCRLHEGGFRLFVGRGGVNVTKWGFLPYGSLVQQGLYVLEGDPDLGTHEISFRSSFPVIVNEWATSVFEQDLVSSTYGAGKGYMVTPAILKRDDGFKVNFRGAFVFKNAEGNWPGLCYDCPLEGPYDPSLSLDVTPPTWPSSSQLVPPYNTLSHVAHNAAPWASNGTPSGSMPSLHYDQEASGCHASIIGIVIATSISIFIVIPIVISIRWLFLRPKCQQTECLGPKCQDTE